MSAIAPSKPSTKLDFLKLMMLSREGDRREGILLRQSKGWFQVPGMGHEAISAIVKSLRDDDWLFPYYRSRAVMLARGMSNYEMALQYLAKRESNSGGRNMPGHYNCGRLNIFSVATPTGATLLPACGVAWGMRLRGKDSVCVASVGDAASRQGEFYEAWAFAVQENLPIIFMIEDNKYGISTPTDHMMALNLGGIISNDRMVKVDGRHVDTVDAAMSAAVAKARSGQGPTLLWVDIDRLSSHTSSDDHRVYRAADDIAAMADRDPIKLLKDELIAAGEITEADVIAIQEELVKLVDADYIKAEQAEEPRASELMEHTWGEQRPAERPPIETGTQTMVDAVNRTFHAALEEDPDFIFFGEDIEDPKGGVFAITKGLSATFPKNVFNSPLAEATIIGVGVGLAAYGFKPVFEIQFIDFLSPAWNQVASNMSTLRWRTFGDQKCPMVVYSPYGAYLPGGGMWHSMSNEAAIAHLPGIKIAIPSTPQDIAGLMWTAMHGSDPTFVMIPKHIFRKRHDVTSFEPVEFGKARIVQEGTDLTIATWANTIELAEEAAQKSGRSIEILDLRTVVPCDMEAIHNSVKKTGRLIVLQEDIRTCGMANNIAAEFVNNPDSFNQLLAPPQVVSRGDVHIGFNPIWEYAALPDLDRVMKAIQVVMD